MLTFEQIRSMLQDKPELILTIFKPWDMVVIQKHLSEMTMDDSQPLIVALLTRNLVLLQPILSNPNHSVTILLVKTIESSYSAITELEEIEMSNLYSSNMNRTFFGAENLGTEPEAQRGQILSNHLNLNSRS